ncbi:CRISPR-associated endoribonuclease Cas6 [Tepidimicrobium xylanilyticum]|uniref:CRISPR-associated endoribonuclease Cas6 n=1 Tax=Tepidimicrobium xylanilyticum TaxID=1123352 RepID=UPI00264A55BD|nr:CRISPR-associated endoribonuclease Cas6 [Tepidimicrobium xylanilyticum]GMG97778.1 CRISPR-associated endoribonuclease Cas6 [Tepidimicrobium xylanilyticum]
MKEIITFYPIDSDKVVLPIQYNHMVQGMIYSILDDELAYFLHEKGFQNQKRTFKMFSFSRLKGSYTLDKKDDLIKFDGPVKLTISSHYDEFSNSIGNGFLRRQRVRLGNNNLEVRELAVEREMVNSEEIRVYALSPISVYITLLRKDGRKFTYYFNPKEDEFSQIISNNLKNKYRAFYSKEPPEGEVKIKPIGLSKLAVVNYKGFIIKGYTGKFLMKGDSLLLQLGVDTGLGSKNSQGFGCVKLI